MPLIRSISGLRGTLLDSLTSEILRDYTLAFLHIISEGKILIGADGRKGFELLYKEVQKTLLEAGREVVSCGIIPTPTMQVLVSELKSAGGIVITASHNPAEWNGLKFIDSDGIFLKPSKVNLLWQRVDNRNSSFQVKTSGILKEFDESFQTHFNKIFNAPLLRENNVFSKIQKRRFRIAIDAINSSGSKILPEFLEKLHCEIIKINCDNNGIFVHNPEPKPKSLEQLSYVVKSNKVDIGFAVDPDADRLVVVDENGNVLSEEMTIVLAFLAVVKLISKSGNTYFRRIVVNYSTTSLIDYVAKQSNFIVFRSPVGEINVVERMIASNSLIGGEGSGGVILSQCHYGRDSLVGIILILSLLIEANKSISAIVNELPKSSMFKTKVKLPNDFEIKLREIIKSFNNIIDLEQEDGLWIKTSDGWLHIRKSNTEPVARIIYESLDNQFISFVSDLIKCNFEVISNE